MTRREEACSAAESSWLVRAYYTPLSDALRGHLSARLDVRPEIAAASLPAPLGKLVYDVVCGTRLWRIEKVDLARELISHFADGLAAGRSPEEFARDFGEAKHAARLIRQAKRRNRAWIWQCWHVTARTVLGVFALACLFYLGASARFYWGQPAIKHNYWQEINAARHVKESDRAWPLYRDALLSIGRADDGKIDLDLLDAGPASKDWAEAEALLARHQDALELARGGATKPTFGYYLGDKDDVEAAKAAGDEWLIHKGMPLADQNIDLISAPLPGPQHARDIVRLLAIDARIAATRGQSDRVFSDLSAMISMSEQLFLPDATLVEQLIGMAILGVTVQTTGTILADAPVALTDEQLVELAHRFAAWRESKKLFDFTGERMLFDDVLQRVYTDDGHGDGRITPEGLSLIAEYAGTENDAANLRFINHKQADDVFQTLVARAVSPGAALLVGGREENRQLYNEMLNEVIAAHQGAPWQWNLAAVDQLEQRLKTQMSSITSRMRHMPVLLLLPALRAVFNAAERALQHRDAAEVMIALELWHRRHGQWPENLAVLVPELLPTVPADRVDGQPLRYAVHDGRPVLYSIGEDRKDDDGRSNVDPERTIPTQFGPLEPSPASVDRDLSGDWILWPPVKKAGD